MSNQTRLCLNSKYLSVPGRICLWYFYPRFWQYFQPSLVLKSLSCTDSIQSEIKISLTFTTFVCIMLTSTWFISATQLIDRTTYTGCSLTWKTEHFGVFHVLLLFEHKSKNLGSRRVKCRTDPLGGFVEPLDKHLLIGEEAQMPRAFFIAPESDHNLALSGH